MLNQSRLLHKTTRPHSLMCFLFFLLMSMMPISGYSITPEPMGPGVAGQIHAMAYDQNNPSTIYIGGDNFGVYKSGDGGESWGPYSRGLVDTEQTSNGYVDGLIVVQPDAVISPDRAGVYAATWGGIYYRENDSCSWELQTPRKSYNRKLWMT